MKLGAIRNSDTHLWPTEPVAAIIYAQILLAPKVNGFSVNTLSGENRGSRIATSPRLVAITHFIDCVASQYMRSSTYVVADASIGCVIAMRTRTFRTASARHRVHIMQSRRHDRVATTATASLSCPSQHSPFRYREYMRSARHCSENLADGARLLFFSIYLCVCVCV